MNSKKRKREVKNKKRFERRDNIVKLHALCRLSVKLPFHRAITKITPNALATPSLALSLSRCCSKLSGLLVSEILAHCHGAERDGPEGQGHLR